MKAAILLLALVLLVPYFILITLKSYSSLGCWGRVWLALCRVLILVLVVLALYGVTIRREVEEDLCNIILVDVSESMDEERISKAGDFINTILKSKKSQDRVGVLAFARSVKLLRDPREESAKEINLSAATAGMDRTATNLHRAVRAAGMLFLDRHKNRVTLLSDGFGDPRKIRLAALRSGVEIDTVPLEKKVPGAQIRNFTATPVVKLGQPVEVRIELDHTTLEEGEVLVMVDGKASESQHVRFEEAQQIILSPQIKEEGLHRVEVVLRAVDDADTRDNVGKALVLVRGKVEVLIIESEVEKLQHVKRIFEDAGMNVTLVAPTEFPRDQKNLDKYDLILISDVENGALPVGGGKSIREYVANGGGLIMAGGGKSFGAGGYYKSEIEEALPVYMDPSREPPVFAVILIVDKSWSMGDMAGNEANKIDLVKEATIAATRQLKDEDFLGILTFDAGTHVIRPLTKINGEKGQIEEMVATLGSFGLTNFYPTMGMAAEMLRDMKNVTKHMVLLSDGRPSGGTKNYKGLIEERMLPYGIKLSAIGCGNDVNEKLLAALALGGKGNYYRIKSEKIVPRVVFEEKKDESKMIELLVVELPLVPKIKYIDRVVKGIPFGTMPELLGYNRMRAKNLADVHMVISKKDEPLLSKWHYGAGRSVVFASDLKGRWTSKWMKGWPKGMSQMLQQMAFWAMSEVEKAKIHVEEKDGIMTVMMDVFHPDGTWDRKAYEGHKVFLRENGKMDEPITFVRSIPGQYRSRFAYPEDAFLVRAAALPAVNAAESVYHGEPYLPGRELRMGKADHPFMKELSVLTGGRFDVKPEDTLGKGKTMRVVDLAPFLFAAAALLFLLEAVLKRKGAVRRLFVRT